MDNKISMHTETALHAEGRGSVSASVSIVITSTVKAVKVRVISTTPVFTYEETRENYLTYYSGPGSLSAGGLAARKELIIA